ncbi:hypothetical protein [Thiofilum flexile]|uniref:hypothetical protein n=1 Tax=Thiofilum flexile TaxID=125627 RepID=UPI00035C488F|nr:hypothetical protein [Thiofilum flexile]
MLKLWTVLPLLILLTSCGGTPTKAVDTATSAPQAVASNSTLPKKEVISAAIPESSPLPQVQVQRASLRTNPTTNNNMTVSTDIINVVFSRTSNPRTPTAQWKQKELRLNNDLTITLTDYNKQGRITGQKKGRISDTEYLALVRSLKGARYQTLNSVKRPQVLRGNVTDIITISTAGDFRQFKEDENQQFPAEVQAIFTRYTKGR